MPVQPLLTDRTPVLHHDAAAAAELAGAERVAATTRPLLRLPVGEVRLTPGATTWAVRTDDDPVRLVPGLPRFVPALAGARPGPLSPGAGSGPHEPDPPGPGAGTRGFLLDDLEHDASALHEAVGPRVRGHLDHLRAGTVSLANVARVVVGQPPVTGPRAQPRRPGRPA